MWGGIETMLIPLAHSDLRTGWGSAAVTAKSPSTTASASVPAKAAHVCTPIAAPSEQQGVVVVRPMVALYIPVLTVPVTPKIGSSLDPSIWLGVITGGEPKLSAGWGAFCRTALWASSAAFTPLPRTST